jgi:signal transduction histidine kinase
MLANKRLESLLLGYLCWRLEDESALNGSVRGLALLGLGDESRDADISISAACDSSDIVSHVTDSGVGIGPEDREHGFEKITLTKRGGRDIGVELGISLVRNHIDLLGGHVKIVADDWIGIDVECRVPASPSTVSSY